jgi:hypothetical protein
LKWSASARGKCPWHEALDRRAAHRGGVDLAVERALVSTRNPNLAPSLILLGAATVPAAFLTFLYGRRLPYTIGAAALYAAARAGWALRRTVGAVAAFAVAVGLHTAWDATRLMPVMAAVAIVSLVALAWTAHRTLCEEPS